MSICTVRESDSSIYVKKLCNNYKTFPLWKMYIYSF